MGETAVARLVPPTIDPACPSPGEKEFFQRLTTDTGTKDWIVLHSLDIAQHRRQISGEADFVIIVPRLGVLCLEIKACRSVRRRRGRWFFGARDQKGETRGPFKQAAEAAHSLRERVREANPSLRNIMFWSAVLFPYLEFREKSPEWHDWQVLDKSDFPRRDPSTVISEVLERAREYLSHVPSASWFNAAKKEPDIKQCQIIASVLRPDFEFYESPRARRKRERAELKRYTEEQFKALDVIGANPRTLCTGPAGCGKTLLAIETARRMDNAGKRVLLLCFNNRLSEHIKRETLGFSKQAAVGTMSQHMLRVSGKPVPSNPGPEFWEDELPELATETLLRTRTSSWTYDHIVLDEVQDLCREKFLDFLDLSLDGGLKGGLWSFFGDFNNQSIYTGPRAEELLQARSSWFARYPLQDNCRNTPRVGSLAHLLGGLKPNYRTYLRPDDLVKPSTFYYRNEDEQIQLLIQTLESLMNDGYSPSEIIILSPKRNSIVQKMPENWKRQLEEHRFDARKITYSTIHAFKGLEAPCVVITDINDYGSDEVTSLFYTGVTRALSKLVCIVNQRIMPDLIDAMTQQLSTKDDT